MIAIIVALPREAAALIEQTENKKTLKIAGKDAVCGTLFGKNVIIAICGIGKVSAALTVQAVIDKYSPEYVLNFGTVGGLNGSVKPLSYYCAEKCCQYDFDLSDVDDVERGYIQDYDRVFFRTETDGLEFLEKAALATADKFTNLDTDVKTVVAMGCVLCDMEGCAIAQVCESNDTKLYIIKGVSDVHGSNLQYEQFLSNLDKVGAGFPDVIKKALNNIK